MYTIPQISAFKNRPDFALTWLIARFAFNEYRLYYAFSRLGQSVDIGDLDNPATSSFLPVHTARGDVKTYVARDSAFNDIERAYTDDELRQPVDIMFVSYWP